MNTRRKRASKRPHTPEKDTHSADSTAPSCRHKSSKLTSAGSTLDECVGALCLVEVAIHSLEWQETGFPEQEVLRRALKAIWCVHDWVYELTPDDLGGAAAEREDEP